MSFQFCPFRKLIRSISMLSFLKLFVKSYSIILYGFFLSLISYNISYGIVTNCVWNGGAAGNWSNATSWSPQIPDADDNVTIATTNAIVTFADASPITIGSLTLQNGAKIDFGSNNIILTVNGNFTVSTTGGGKITGSSGSVIISSSVAGALVSLTNAIIDVPLSITLASGTVTLAAGSIYSNTVTSASSSLSVTGSTFLSGAVLSGNIVTNIKQNFFGTEGQTTAFPTTITDNGGSSSTVRTWYGGNTFYGPGSINHSAGGTIYMGSTLGDKFYGAAIITNTSTCTGSTYVAHNSLGSPSLFNQGLELNNNGIADCVLYVARTTSSSTPSPIPLLAEIHGDIKVNSWGSGASSAKSILIGNYGSVDQYDGTILVGSNSFVNGYLYLSRIRQIFSTGTLPLANALTLTSQGCLGMYKCDFPGGGNFTAPVVFNIQQNIFGDTLSKKQVSFTENGQSSFYYFPGSNTSNTDHLWYGGNIFNGRCNINNFGRGAIYTANNLGDTFQDTVVITNTGVTYVAHNSVSQPSIFKKGLELKNNSGTLYVARASSSYTPVTAPVLAKVYGDIKVNSWGSGNSKGIVIGNQGAVAQYDGTILVGGNGFNTGYLQLSRIRQNYGTGTQLLANTLTLTGIGCLALSNCDFPAGGVFTAPMIFELKQNIFGDTLLKKQVSFIENGTSSTYWFPGSNFYNSDHYWYGGNVFNGKYNFTNSGSNVLFMSNGQGDTFKDSATFTSVSGATTIAYNSVGSPSIFRKGLELNVNGPWAALNMATMPSNASPSIPPSLAEVYGNIKVNSGGSASSVKGLTIGNKGAVNQYNGNISVGSTGFVNGYLYLTNITQKFLQGNVPAEPVANSIALTYQSCLGLYKCNFPGGGNFSAPFLFDLKQNILGDSVYKKPSTFYDFGNGTYIYPGVDNYQSNRSLYGDNKFYGPATINYSGYGIFYMANTLGDNFYDNVTYTISSNAGVAYFANKGNTNFYKNLTFTSAKTTNVSSGQSDFGQGQLAGEFIKFAGNGDQSISVSGAFNKGLNFKNLQVNKPSGNVLLTYPVAVNGVLNLTTGNIVPSLTNSLSLSASASTTGASAASYITGPLIKTGTTPFTYPIGKPGNYAPVSITFPAASSSIQAEYFPQAATLAANFTAPVVSISEFEYWTLTDRQGNAPVVTPSLSWNDLQTLTYVPSADVAVLASNKTSQNSWSKINSTVTGTDVSGSMIGTQSITLGSTGVTNLTFGFNTAINKGKVTNNLDTGPGSLRNAIIWANSNPDTTIIGFKIPALKSKTITVLSELPAITTPVILDGTTQLSYDKAVESTIVEIKNGNGLLNGILFEGNCIGSEIKGLRITDFSDSGIRFHLEDVKVQDVKIH